MAQRELDYDQFRASVSREVVPLAFHCPDPDQFRGDLSHGDGGDVTAISVAAPGHSVHRTPVLVKSTPRRLIKCTLVEEGTGIIVQDGRETALQPGDITLHDTSRPYSLLFDDDMRITVVMFPPEMLRLPYEVVSRLTATRLNDDGGLDAIVTSFQGSISRRLDVLPTRVEKRLIRMSVRLVELLVEAQLDRLGLTGTNDGAMVRILDYIDENLSRSDLSPSQIAAAQYMSTRHLHALFAAEGTTVSAVIRLHRLERCYDELCDKRHAQRSVNAIAVGNGFVSAAHFSRLFRAHFGITPSAVRRMAFEPSPGSARQRITLSGLES